MWRRSGPASLAFVLSLLVTGLPFLAYASPPDPSWVRGLFDDADFDDVVCFIISSAGLVNDVSSTSPRPDLTLVDVEIPLDDRFVAQSSLRVSPPRAPPAS
jgi:hypothetical protein